LAKRNHGTLTNGPIWSGQSHPGGWGSLAIDATNDFVALPTLLTGTNPVTVCGWGMPNTNTINDKMLFSNQGGGGSRFYLYRNGTGYNLRLGDQTINAASTVVVGRWAHLCGTWDGTTATFYLNGNLVGSNSSTNLTGFAVNQCLGAYGQIAGNSQWDGFIDNVSVYNRALSASEVSALYQESLAGHPTTLNWLRPRIYFDAGGAPAGGAFSIFDSPIITAAA
jgi:hypothetical protein